MSFRNIFKIRRGAAVPTTSNIDQYELGYSTDNKALYINDGGTIQRIGGEVLSVNGQTGTVTLDAEDVEARPEDWFPNKGTFTEISTGSIKDFVLALSDGFYPIYSDSSSLTDIPASDFSIFTGYVEKSEGSIYVEIHNSTGDSANIKYYNSTWLSWNIHRESMYEAVNTTVTTLTGGQWNTVTQIDDVPPGRYIGIATFTAGTGGVSSTILINFTNSGVSQRFNGGMNEGGGGFVLTTPFTITTTQTIQMAIYLYGSGSSANIRQAKLVLYGI